MPRIDDMTTGIPRTELNILFLIETSSSYDQLTREKINEFYNKMLVKLRNVSCDFFCKIAIAHFSEQISWIEPEFTEIQKVQYKPINFDGTTNISNMFDRINKKLSKDSLLKDIIYFSRPVIIFISDGHFDYKSSEEFVQLLNNKWYRRSQRICFYASSNPNFEHLNDIVVGNGAIACIDDENAVDTLIEEKIQEINIVSPTFDLEEDHKWNRLINKFKPKIIGKINRIVRLRINSDGDGVRSVVFLQNCPLSCSWCCNPETRFGKKFYEKDTDELYELIKRDIPYFDYSEGGVTFTGGEPLLQSDYIIEFAENHKDIGNIDIETSLYADAEVITKITPYINEWIIDYKCHDEKSHIEYTGVSNDIIKKNLKWLANTIDKKRIHIAFPIIPGKNDSDENISDMICFMNEVGLSSVYLHPYRKKSEGKYKKLKLEHEDIPPVPIERLFQIEKMFEEHGISTTKKKVYVEKEKCRFLKDTRKKICTDRNINILFEECKYEGVCPGTCPKCESELDIINAEYKRKVR